MLWLLVILAAAPTVSLVRVGQLRSYQILGIAQKSFANMTVSECICKMLRAGESVSAVNYCVINQTCDLFYSNASPLVLEPNSNCAVMFFNRSLASFSIIPTQGQFERFE